MTVNTNFANLQQISVYKQSREALFYSEPSFCGSWMSPRTDLHHPATHTHTQA